MTADNFPEVPEIVITLVPAGAVAPDRIVSTLAPEVGFLLHDAVTPFGSVEVIAKVTFPLKPAASVTLTVVVEDCPGRIEILLEEASIQNPGTCLPARSSIRLCPLALPQPVTRS